MYNENNIFNKLINKEIDCNEVYRDEEILAFYDISPASPIHILVIPVAKYTSFDDFIENASPDFIAKFFRKVKEIAKQKSLEEGYRLITNIGKNASQTVPHFHVHILGGKALGGLLPKDTEVR